MGREVIVGIIMMMRTAAEKAETPKNIGNGKKYGKNGLG